MLLARSELPLRSRNLLDMEMLERKVSNVLISKKIKGGWTLVKLILVERKQD